MVEMEELWREERHLCGQEIYIIFFAQPEGKVSGVDEGKHVVKSSREAIAKSGEYMACEQDLICCT